MIERVLFIIWGVWLLLLFVAAFRVFGFLIARRRQDRRWGDGSRNQRPVAVILAVKGFDLQSSPQFFDTIFAQDYSNYRVIVCFESWDDMIAQWLKEQFDLTGDRDIWTHPDPDSNLKSVSLVCAGNSKAEGQKVHNQRAAFRTLTDRDEVIAFADADIFCKSDWLAKLVAPINQKTHPLSTTYRWLVPKRPTLPNQLASVINGSIATQGGSELTNVLWGGSMAIAKSVFDELKVPELFEGSLNDDLRLSKAARRAGNRIAFVRSLILPTMIDFNWRSFIEFAKRQYTQVKFFSPILYTGTNIILGFYVFGLLTIIAALVYGYFYAWIPVAAAYVIDQFRALARQQIYLSLFEENGIRRRLFSASWLEHMLTPFWMVVHWLLLFSTWPQSRITWAGIRYRIYSSSKTKILFRPSMVERLPAGVPGLALISEIHDHQYTQRVATVPEVAGSSTTGESKTEPATRPKEAPNYNEIEEIAAEITGPATATESEAVSSPTADPSKPVSHPGAPSAVTLLRKGRPRIRRAGFQPERRHSPSTTLVERRLQKTRIPISRRYPVTPIQVSPRRIPDPATETISKSKSEYPTVSNARTLSWPSSHSMAAHRAIGCGSRINTGKHPGTPARSSRTSPAARGRKQSGSSRKANGRVSSRPRS